MKPSHCVPLLPGQPQLPPVAAGLWSLVWDFQGQVLHLVASHAQVRHLAPTASQPGVAAVSLERPFLKVYQLSVVLEA
jgi:hypothetical protein